MNHGVVGAGGDEKGFNENLYDELRAIAHSLVRGQPGGGPESCSLVAQAYLKVPAESLRRMGPQEAIAYVTRVMKNILTDAARRRARERDHSEGVARYLDGRHLLMTRPQLLVEVDDLIDALERTREIKHGQDGATIVRLMIYLDMSDQEIATALNRSRAYVQRQRSIALAWMESHLADIGLLKAPNPAGEGHHDEDC